MQNNVILKVDDVAEWLGVSKAHIYQLVRSGEIPHFRVGKAIRFHYDTLVAWAKRETNNNREAI